VVGDSRIWFFFRATEAAYASGSYPTDIGAIDSQYRVNLYYSRLPGPVQIQYWLPLHNSYDPYDQDIETGHNFGQHSWTRGATTRAFAKANKLVHQKPVENPQIVCIDIIKGGPATAPISDTITYTFTVANCGEVDLSSVTVTDTLLTGTRWSTDTLKVEVSYTFTDTYKIPVDAPDPLTDTATASGKYDTKTVTDQDSHSVDIFTKVSCIDIIKEGPAAAKIGDTVTYTFTVANCGEVDLSSVAVTDTLLGSYPIAALGVGASYTFTDTYKIPEPPPSDPLVNTATASGWDGHKTVTDQDSHYDDIFTEAPEPCIDIIKEGPATAPISDTITYTFTVANCGHVDLSTVTVTDTLVLATIWSTPTLTVGVSYTFTDTYKIPVDAPDPLTNTATASGEYEGTVTDQDSHSVDIFTRLSCIDINKEGPATAQIGDTITYTFTVANCGDVDLSTVAVTDTLIATAFWTTPTLAVGVSYTFTDTYEIPGGAPDPLTNTGMASGRDSHKTVTDQHSHSVDLVERTFSFHICGEKFQDSDRDGVYSFEAEHGIDEVTVILLGPDQTTKGIVYYPELSYPPPEDASPDILATGENQLEGSYCFNLVAGLAASGKTYTFYVKIVEPAGRVATSPTLIGPIELEASADGARESLGNHFGNAPPPPVPVPIGGIVIPVSKLELLAPWIGLAALASIAVLAAVAVRRRKA